MFTQANAYRDWNLLKNYLQKIRSRPAAADKSVLRQSTTDIIFPISAFVIILLILGDIGVCASQFNSDQTMVVPIPHPITSILRSKKIHHELGLSEAQINDIAKTIGEIELTLWRLRDMPAKKRNETAISLISQLKNSLSALLADGQYERLNQLVRQAQGVEVILESQIKAKISLSPEQTESIKSILSTLYSNIASLHNNSAISSQSLKATYIKKLRANTEKNILAVLNNYQRQTFLKLFGLPFDLSQIRSIACKAPEFEIDTWINSSPVKISELRGEVTVVHFYAFGCGNCIRSLPYYNDWRKRFKASSFSIIGIHRPETKQERNVDKVKDKAVEAGMEYPIAIDNKSLAWNAWANRIWPSIYLVDKNGFVRYWWYGELNWQGAETEKYLREKIQELIEEPSL